ncbi:hypothetical protein [Leptospira ryugenii]|uniref:hypothetical protein n=1 Tax=Leptospira ryugenii TaxID=1917863 RepID=UPI001FCEDE84|nr:hypothetical protein [Leptospira ryugenii]
MTQTAQNPLNQIAEISTTNPGKKGLAPDAMDLGYTVRLDLGQSLSPNIGLSSVPKVPVARQTYSLFQANSQLKVETSVTEVDVASTFQKTSNGIYQYSQLLSMNENNDRSALFEQRRMINQNAYNIDWGARSVARFDDNGNLEGDARFKDILTILTDTKKSKPLIDSCMADTKKSYQDCFNKVHGQTLDRLIKIDGSLRFEDGMIVRSLTENESKLLGLSPIQDPKQPDARHGICYINPNDPECVALKLLRKDFDVDFNESTRVATFTKIISNGKIGGRNAKGEYISGTQAERRSMYLSSVDPVMAPKGKDLFDIWGNDDWKDVEAQNMAVNQTFYSRKLTADSKTIQSSVASILKVESENDAKFRKAKQDQEAQDSLIKDLIIAYISGGMAGVKGAIKSKVEDKINASLAEAWARASGADEDQISMLADAVSFLRGKVQEKKIKDRANSFSTNNPLRAIENSFAKVNSFANNVSGGLTGTMTGLMVSAGTTIVKTMAKATDSVFNAVGPGVAATINPMLTVTGKVMQSTSDYLDKQLPKMTGGKDAISAIRANEKGLIQKYATTALATSAGLPQEVASNIIGDYVGSQAAKKARRAVASNPLGNVASQIVGVAGGIIKTAAAGLGMKERDLQQVFSQGNRIANAGSLDSSTAEIQSEAMMNQMFGMKSSALSYTSSTPTLKDKNGFTKELFQREAVKQLSVGMSENERAILNSAFRANVSKREQSRADKKAQKEAARSTAITVITTAVSFGALSALGPLGSAIQSGINAVGNVVSAGINAVGGAISSLAPTLGSIASNVGSFLNVAAASAPQVGTAAIQTTVQVIDGSRNGPEGMLAGLANGVLSYFGKSGSFDLGDVTSSLGPKLGKFLSHSAVGVGVTYDKQNKWGAMIGLGSGSVNANISFSEKGNTTISGSAAPIPGMEKLQFTASTTTNGSTSIGVNVNAGKGPREGWNVGANYDINGGGLSGSIGYTDPNTGLGLTSTIDQYGLSTSAQLNGINLATNGPNGFVMEEINWAEQNINLAQDRTNRLQERANLIADGVPPAVAERIMNAQLNNETLSESDQALVNRAQERQILRDAGKSDEDINKMSPGERGDRVADLSKPRPYDPETIAVSAAASIGTFFAGAFAFAGGGNANNGGNQTPTNNPAVAERPVRMRKEEEGDSEVEVDRDGIRLDNNERPVSLVDATDRNPFSQFFVPDGYQNGFYDPRLDPDYRRPGQSDESEETINHVIDRNTRGIYKLSEEQLETYREKEKNLDKKLKASEPPIKSKTENLLASEENELTNLRKKRTELTEAFKQKMRNDIRNSSSDSPYKESADLAKVRKVYEAELAKLDKGIKSLNAKADIPFKTPVKPSDIVAEATSRTNYEKIMGLSKDEAIQRNRELTEERALKGKVDKDLQDQRSTIDGLNKAVKLLEEKQSSSKLSEAEKTRLGSEKKNLQETVERERQVYADKLAKQESVYKEAFEKKTRESKEIINKIYDDQIKIKETELESKKDSKEKTDIDRVKKLKAEIAQLETNKNTAIDSIDNKYKSSKVIVMDQPQDAIPDRYAKFHDPKALIDRHTKANLEFINEKLYSEDKPDFTMKDLPGNPPRKQLIIKDSNGLESGVIILGTESVNQHNDYGEKVVVISDRLEDIPAGHWDSDLGKYVYIQAGGNTCQSYTLLGQMVQEGVKFRDNSDMGRKLIHELTRLQYQMGETGNMSKDTINAYNRILDQFGLKARNIMDDKAIKTIEDKHNAIKEQLKKGKIVNSGMYLDAPPAEPKYNEKGEIKEPSQGHRVNIVGFDDERGEWIVNDSNRKDQLIRYPYGNYELGNRWSTVLEKK